MLNKKKSHWPKKIREANVIVTAAGGIIAQGIIKSLKLANILSHNKITYRIITTDLNSQSAGLYRSDLGFIVPPSSSSDYIKTLIKLAVDENIDAIYPGSDEELLVIGKAKKKIEKATNAKVLTSPVDVLITARDKWKTFKFLSKNNLPAAKSVLPKDCESITQEFGFPVVVKPREGYGSLHFYIANDKDELNYSISKIRRAGWHPIIQEYLDSDVEFTSGVTVDKSGSQVMSSISIKKTIKNGQTYKAHIDDFRDIRRYSESVALKLGARGAVNIQAKLTDGGLPKVFEINPRFSATCPMRSAAGINEPDIVFRNTCLGEEIKVPDYKKLLCLRYWNELYIPTATYELFCKEGKINNPNDSFILKYF
ncbi:MAG TPA: ATP-grasp domain-containing protein [Nitrososphaeraceae archaeon]|nr:ATP-grasp domain-containing protein [Nitrososphaeraceae archaeon]